MSVIRAVTVYCSSSKSVAPVYFQAARELGAEIAHHGWALVYGGNNVGTMGALADSVRAAGGKVIGITPQLLVDKGIADTKCDELVVTEGMRERKALMEERGDAFIAMPGGVGTLEEVFEILVGRYLGFHGKPIVLLNVDGFYAPLLEMLERGMSTGFIRRAVEKCYFVADGVRAAVEYLQAAHVTAPKPGVSDANLNAAAE